MTELAGLACGDDPRAWEALGFVVDSGVTRVGPVAVGLDGGGGGLRGWTLRGSGPGRVAGVATTWVSDAAPGPAGERALDHLVLMTGDLDAAVAELVAAGGAERRRAGPPAVPAAMSFVRMGEVIVEVVEDPRGPAGLWGLVAVVDDLGDLPVDLVGSARDAVQPGRRIATVRPQAGLGAQLAFMTPRRA